MAIAVSTFGEYKGKRVDQFHLVSETGVEVDIIGYGVVVRDWRVPVAGALRSVVLGFDTFEAYPEHSPHLGSLAGRVANRIKNSAFTLDGTTPMRCPPTRAACTCMAAARAWAGRSGTGRWTRPTMRCASPISRPTAPWAIRAMSISRRPIRSRATACCSSSAPPPTAPRRSAWCSTSISTWAPARTCSTMWCRSIPAPAPNWATTWRPPAPSCPLRHDLRPAPAAQPAGRPRAPGRL